MTCIVNSSAIGMLVETTCSWWRSMELLKTLHKRCA